MTAAEREILTGVPVIPPRDEHADPSYRLADIKALAGVVVTEPPATPVGSMT